MKRAVLKSREKNIAVLGGGLQGSCLALALAARGARVTLFDRNDRLLTRAAVVNEGKIHLGYIYAGDSSLKTARMMMRGAFSFAGFVERHLGVDLAAIETSKPAVYLVHRDTTLGVAEVGAHLRAVSLLAREVASGRQDAYFGIDLDRLPRRWAAGELVDHFDPSAILAAFDTNEIAIQPTALAELIRARIDDIPAIEVRLSHFVESVDLDGHRPALITTVGGEPRREAFDEIVNALWDGRLVLDAKLGMHPSRPWLHRFKYGVRFQLPDAFERPPSATFVFGSFGEVVAFEGGTVFLTWYPTCMVATSSGLEPPDCPAAPEGTVREEILSSTYDSLSKIVLGLRGVPLSTLHAAAVKGGVIVAWGQTDINDPASELHQRFELGLTSSGSYHSLDPGKFTLAPYFAELTAERIMPE